MSIRAEYLSTYAKKNSGYNRRQMKFLISHSAITRHIKIKAAVGAFMHERLRKMCSSLQACFFDLTHSIKTMKKEFIQIILSVAACCTVMAESKLPFINSDFESGDLTNWIVDGTAFARNPFQRSGDKKDQRLHGSMQGDYCANSSVHGDYHIGSLTSTAFIITRDYLTFRIAGGVEKDTRVELIIEGEPVKDCSGIENWILKSNYFDLSEWRGQSAQIRIIDEVEAPWGHIIADDFQLTDTRPNFLAWDQHERTFTVSKKHLVLPIHNLPETVERGFRDRRDWLEVKGSPVQLLVDSKPIRHYWAKLAENTAATHWYASLSLEDFEGKEVTVRSWRSTEAGFDLIRQSNTIPGEEHFHKEAFRPKFHFTQKTGFNNDPNGMVYHEGIWHYFWQHNPMKKTMGNQTWGHATSTDLLHWTQHKGALFPYTNGDHYMFSGSGTVDKQNTAGFGENAIVLFFTNTSVGECIAYSNDGGKSFQRYENNPIITFDKHGTSGKPFHVGRDPKVIWYAYDAADTPLNETAAKLDGHWVMLVYDFTNGKENQSGRFYSSVDMKHWEHQSDLFGYFECMELFELPVDGDEINTRWVIYSGDAKYAVGDFDGKTFTPEHEGKYRLHYGTYYASQTFDNAPGGRKIQVGWNTSRAAPEAPYAGHHSFPHNLTLHEEAGGIRMRANPIEEIKELRVRSHHLENVKFTDSTPAILPLNSNTFDLTLEFEPGDTEQVILNIPGTHIRYKPKEQMIEHREIPLKLIDGRVKIRVLVDVCLYEIVGNDGRVYVSLPRDYKQKISEIKLEARGGTAKLNQLKVHELKSIWD